MSTDEVERAKLLEVLPSETREYVFTSVEDMVDILEQPDQNPYVVFTQVPPPTITPDSLEGVPGRKDYYAKFELLIVNLLDTPHEAAVGRLHSLITTRAIEMNLLRSFRCLGAALRDTPLRSKQPDSSFRPITGHGSPTWTTVVVEVGYSESREKLLRDVAFWLNQSDGKVLLVISIYISRPSGTIYINTWEQGVACTRKHPDPQPRQLQEIIIDRGNNGTQPSIIGDHLTIPFHALFFRLPSGSEADLVFTEDELMMIAEDVWEEMEALGHLRV